MDSASESGVQKEAGDGLLTLKAAVQEKSVLFYHLGPLCCGQSPSPFEPSSPSVKQRCRTYTYPEDLCKVPDTGPGTRTHSP